MKSLREKGRVELRNIGYHGGGTSPNVRVLAGGFPEPSILYEKGGVKNIEGRKGKCVRAGSGRILGVPG